MNASSPAPAILVLSLAIAMMLGGCESVQLARLIPTAPTARIESLGDEPVVLSGRFSTSVYALRNGVEASYLLSDIPIDALLEGEMRDGQILHVELLWEPKAGSTPMNPSVTNASVRHVIIIDGEVGVYGGAGFALPKGRVGQRKSELSITNASLKLLEKTSGFNDLLTPAHLSATISATLDERATIMLQLAASQLVTNAMGSSRFVDYGGNATTLQRPHAKTATRRIAANSCLSTSTIPAEVSFSR